MSYRAPFRSNAFAASVLSLAVGLSLVACSGKSEPPSTQAASNAAVENTQEAELKAREAAVAQREAELAAKEQQEKDRLQAEADAAAAQKASEEAAANAKLAASEKAAAAKKAAQARAAANAKAAEKAASATPVKTTPAPKLAEPIQVPAGTQLTVSLSSDLSSKTAQVGDPFEARLVADLIVNNRRAVPASAKVTGTITNVVSGSRSIGAIPAVVLKLDRLVMDDGQNIPISGELVEQGASERGRDTAKILGGVAAGAVVGHQVKKGDSGKILGGLLGGVVGAVAAKKTGTEVTLPAGSTLTIAIGEPFTVVTQ